MENVLKNDWRPLLASEFDKEYYRTLADFLKEVRYTCCLSKSRRYI